MSGRRFPISTYRLQLHAGFTFRDAAEIVPYLDQLGITDCYCSPCCRPRPGSTHGYDICDFSQLNPELGGDEAFDLFAQRRAEHGMGLVLDLCPITWAWIRP